jgi:hypothetical protein
VDKAIIVHENGASTIFWLLNLSGTIQNNSISKVMKSSVKMKWDFSTTYGYTRLWLTAAKFSRN